MSVMEKAARVLSFVFGPPAVPVYGIWMALNLSVLNAVPSATRWNVAVMVAIMVCLLPLAGIWALWKLGFVSSLSLRRQEERTVPYLIMLLCYVGCTYFLYRINAPMWLVLFMAGAVAAVIVCAVVNRKWKISAHMTAMGGFMALVMRMAVDNLGIVDMLWPVAIVAMLCGLVGTSRVLMCRHTLMQVAAGFLNGFLCVYAISALW